MHSSALLHVLFVDPISTPWNSHGSGWHGHLEDPFPLPTGGSSTSMWLALVPGRDQGEGGFCLTVTNGPRRGAVDRSLLAWNQ